MSVKEKLLRAFDNGSNDLMESIKAKKPIIRYDSTVIAKCLPNIPFDLYLNHSTDNHPYTVAYSRFKF